MTPGTLSVLFVCTGNICRSPTAEGVFRHLVTADGRGSSFHIDSAGTQGFHAGESPDPRASFTAARHGVDLTVLRARAVTKADLSRFGLVLAMDGTHLDHLNRLAARTPGASAEIALFLDYAGMGWADVPDPYYGSGEGFEQVFDLIHLGCTRVLKRL